MVEDPYPLLIMEKWNHESFTISNPNTRWT